MTGRKDNRSEDRPVCTELTVSRRAHPRWEDADATVLPLPDAATMGKELSEDEQDKQNGLKQEVGMDTTFARRERF